MGGRETAFDRAALASDERQERMDRVAVLYGEIMAATREFLRALAACDRHRDWAEAGFASCAEWLAWRIGVTRNTANEKVRAARALEGLPLISEAMDRGELSFSKVRALTRAATPDNEAQLLAYATACSAASLERLVRGWKTLVRLEEAKAERLRHRLRSFSVFPSEDGMYVVRGVVSPEVGAVLMRAIEAASHALYRERGGPPRGESVRSDAAAPGPDALLDGVDPPEPQQLRADALGLVAERALAAGFGAVAAEGDLAPDPPISGVRAERYQVVLHVEPRTLAAEGEPGMSELEDGTRVTAETARRLACDAALVEVREGNVRGTEVADGVGTSRVAAESTSMDVGRRTRTIPPALRRVLEARDRGCRFPGCGLRFTDAHHIEHWADGGETTLRNTVLLCRRHHRLVHEEGHRICMDGDGRVVFFSPLGAPIAAAPPPVRRPGRPDHCARRGPADALVARNRSRGVEPDWLSCLPRYRYERDIPVEVEIAALEAMDRRLGGAEEGEAARAAGDLEDAA